MSESGPWAWHVEKVRSLSTWYGSLGMLIPAAVCERVIAEEPRWYGFDAHLLRWAQREKHPFLIANPNLVQQRVPEAE